MEPHAGHLLGHVRPAPEQIGAAPGEEVASPGRADFHEADEVRDPVEERPHHQVALVREEPTGRRQAQHHLAGGGGHAGQQAADGSGDRVQRVPGGPDGGEGRDVARVLHGTLLNLDDTAASPGEEPEHRPPLSRPDDRLQLRAELPGRLPANGRRDEMGGDADAIEGVADQRGLLLELRRILEVLPLAAAAASKVRAERAHDPGRRHLEGHQLPSRPAALDAENADAGLFARRGVGHSHFAAGHGRDRLPGGAHPREAHNDLLSLDEAGAGCPPSLRGPRLPSPGGPRACGVSQDVPPERVRGHEAALGSGG